MSKLTGKHVLVTTQHRGVFAGVLVGNESKAELKLKAARNCIRWRNKRGFLGLASHGPDSDCLIGPIVPGELKIYDITSIAECTEVATNAWKNA